MKECLFRGVDDVMPEATDRSARDAVAVRCGCGAIVMVPEANNDAMPDEAADRSARDEVTLFHVFWDRVALKSGVLLLRMVVKLEPMLLLPVRVGREVFPRPPLMVVIVSFLLPLSRPRADLAVSRVDMMMVLNHGWWIINQCV